MAEKQLQFYAAIDLGTTNSVISYANIIRDKMKPIILNVDRKNDTGSTSRSPLLPSVVFYYKNKEGNIVTDIGDYAKSRYGTRAGYVCKSVKSLMGVTNQVPLVDEVPDKTPADVSGQILSYMVNAARKKLFQPDLRDIIITVPASFDSDQCQATIDAARKAGINVENMHDILLYEPKAVIYDFMRMQEDGEIPSNLLSLDTDKNVMVFDLGGGTLDVTIHKVGYTEQGIINIKDLAISRYTQIGGDNFDELLATDMLKRFEEMYGIKVSIKRREEVMCKLRKLAEQLKIELSLAYESAKMSDFDLPDDYELEVMDISLYDAYAYEDTYTKAEVEQILAPLMGYKYKKEDVSRIHRMDEKDVNNIMYPVLDVLDKAGRGTKIDAVILNGGMTKFYMIRQRLKEFFGFDPLETSDPDLAVARGAVYYHYCLHKYNIRNTDYAESTETKSSSASEAPVISKPVFNTATILNDSINIGLRNEYVSLLVPAGTELPYRSEEIRDRYRLERTTDTIGIEMFLGRGKTKNLPNRRIATRVVKFNKSYPVNTPISFQVYINAMRMMTMEAWITDHPNTKTIMEMDMASLRVEQKSSGGLGSVEKMVLNARSEINALRTKRKMAEVVSILKNIGQAANPQDFFEPCMEAAKNCRQSDLMLGNMYEIATGFKDKWTPFQMRQILRMAKEHFSVYSESVRQVDYVLEKALELIGATEPDFADFCRDYLKRRPQTKQQFKQKMLVLVMKYEQDEVKAIKFYEEFFQMQDYTVQIAKAIVERFGRGTSKEHQAELAKLVRTLASALNTEDRKTVPQSLVVLLAELFSEDTENPLLNDDDTYGLVYNRIFAYLYDEPSEVFFSAISNIWNGYALTEEEKQTINGIMRGY